MEKAGTNSLGCWHGNWVVSRERSPHSPLAFAASCSLAVRLWRKVLGEENSGLEEFLFESQ